MSAPSSAEPPRHPSPLPHTRLRTLATPLLVATLLLLIWAAITWLTGGFAYRREWIRFSSRDPLRPLVLGLVCLALLARFVGWTTVERTAGRIWAAIGRLAPAGAAGAAAVVCSLGLAFGTYAAGGSDAYGYISQADLWARGKLSVDFASLAPLPWRDAEWTLSPLGYRPATTPYRIVPTYAPGLPMLMAAFQLALGPAGVYWVVPLCAALAVWLTYVLGSQLDSRHTGLLGAALLATSPAFIFQTMSPMSDVPVTTFWLLALVSANSARRAAPAVSGLAAAIAVLIRPNLVPLAAVPALWIAARRPGGNVKLRIALAMYAGALLPGPVIVAMLNAYWYGSPLQSGYGSFKELYRIANVVANAQHYFRWLVETQSLVIVFAIVPFLSARWRSASGSINQPLVRVGLALFAGLLLGSYLFYLVFEEWWYLRFLLPFYPLLAVLTVSGLLTTLRRVRIPELVSLLVVIPLIAWMFHVGASRAVFKLQTFEWRYVRVGQAVRTLLPPRAVVFAMQHSGSVRYYANRLTLRYDFLPADSLDRAVTHLRARGMSPYLLVEQWEEPAFIKRFERESCRGTLRWHPMQQWKETLTIRLYDLSVPDCRRSPL
jgi:hypothetical protein